MEFTFTTDYNAKTLAVMAKGLRKTLRSRKSRRTTVFAIIVVALALLLVMPKPGESFRPDFGNVITLTAAVVMVVTLIFQDSLNGYIASRRMIQGMSPATCTFKEENYTSQTPIGTTVFGYSNISAIAENNRYFVFLIDKNHGQLYDKNSMAGSIEAFKDFIKGKTGLEIVEF